MKTLFHRREFLSRVIMISAAGSLPAFAFTPMGTLPGVIRKKVMLQKLTVAHFTPHVGETFLLRTESGKQFEVELTEATSLTMNGVRPAHLTRRVPFSLVFAAPPDSGLVQGIYHLDHEGMGDFDVFLVPIGKDKSGLKCQAIFN
jgi:hypothetical protein